MATLVIRSMVTVAMVKGLRQFLDTVVQVSNVGYGSPVSNIGYGSSADYGIHSFQGRSVHIINISVLKSAMREGAEFIDLAGAREIEGAVMTEQLEHVSGGVRGSADGCGVVWEKANFWW